jgi:hypothetical protein
MAFVYNDIDASLANWCDLFLSTVSDYVPKRRVKNTRDHPWLDDELLKAIKHKNRCRKKALKTRSEILAICLSLRKFDVRPSSSFY